MGQAVFHVGVGRGLEGVGEGRERERAVFAFEGGLQDQVRQLRVFGQQTPIGRLGTPEDIAQAMLYLADAPFLTGQTLPLNGGFVIT